MRYGLVSAEGIILRYQDWADAPMPDQSSLAPGKARWLPVEVTAPEHQPNSQRLVGPVVEVLSDRISETWTVEAIPIDDRREAMRKEVNIIRDQKLRRPFPFNGVRFDYDDDSQKRITGAGALVHIAITIGGKLPNDPRWHDGGEDFVWIAADNSLVPMDAQTVLAFGQAAGAWDSAHVFAAKAIKTAIDAADHATLDLIDLDAGWPS